MEWYVYRQDFNTRKIEKFNVFNHGRFRYDVQRLLDGEEVYVSGDTFSEKLRHLTMYFFWAKCEYEVVITSWPPRITEDEFVRLETAFQQYENDWGHSPASMDVRFTVGEKIDIYDQLMLNWDAFVAYVENFESEEN